MFLAKNIRYLRLKYGLSQDYVAEKLGYDSYTTIQKWESGKSEPPLGKFYLLSQMFNADMHTLYTVDLSAGEQSNILCNKIPVLGTIAAGSPILAEQNIEDYFYIDSSINADFALKVKGDSMIYAGIFPGDIAFIRQQETLENGEIGAIIVNNEATLKRFRRSDGRIVLLPENNQYEPLIYSNGDVRILGKLVAIFSYRNGKRQMIYYGR